MPRRDDGTHWIAVTILAVMVVLLVVLLVVQGLGIQ